MAVNVSTEAPKIFISSCWGHHLFSCCEKVKWGQGRVRVVLDKVSIYLLPIRARRTWPNHKPGLPNLDCVALGGNI